MSNKTTELLYARTCDYPDCTRACMFLTTYSGKKLALCGEHDNADSAKEVLKPDPEYVPAVPNPDLPNDETTGPQEDAKPLK
jgi:hypothetical protein